MNVKVVFMQDYTKSFERGLGLWIGLDRPKDDTL